MKKIKVLISEDSWNLMKNDAIEFGITTNKLCNYILEKLRYNKKIETEKLLEIQEKPLKKIINFDLNISNKEIYYEILKFNNVIVEAEYFRSLFKSYTSNFKYQRELFILEEKVKIILEAIEKKKRIKLKYLKKYFSLDPYFIKCDDKREKNFLLSYDYKRKKYISLTLKEIEKVKILEENIESKRNKKVNFGMFLKEKNIIKVKFTEVGKILFKNFTNNRPKLLKKERDIHFF